VEDIALEDEMKRIGTIVLAVLLLATVLLSCGTPPAEVGTEPVRETAPIETTAIPTGDPIQESVTTPPQTEPTHSPTEVTESTQPLTFPTEEHEESSQPAEEPTESEATEPQEDELPMVPVL
jgi:hypothetical protein